MSLAGKVAIVTVSGRWLGLAYAQELARQGAAVVVNDVDDDVAADAAATITDSGGRATAAAGITGQAVGIGGDRLAMWTHPQESVVAFADHGGGDDELTQEWDSLLGQHLQSVGQPMPTPPGDKT